MRVIIFLLCWAVCWGGSEAVANNPQTVRLQAYNLEPSLQPDPNQSERERVSKKRARTWAKKVQKRLPKAKSGSRLFFLEDLLITLGWLVVLGLLIWGLVGFIIGLKIGSVWIGLSAVVGTLIGLILSAILVDNQGASIQDEILTMGLIVMYLIGYLIFMFVSWLILY